MEGDLIRRQDVTEFMFENRYCTSVDNAYDQLKNIPAAYDVGKVLEQLEILLEKETALICRHVSDASYMAAVIGHTMLVDAIEIVKSGGVNTGNGKNGGMQSDRAGRGIDT